uniref:Uncharacterized protein n=1 Tax=Anguilla anguilla TaxID=7936 RepID=A0A0E9VAJ0_ANGAN
MWSLKRQLVYLDRVVRFKRWQLTAGDPRPVSDSTWGGDLAVSAF